MTKYRQELCAYPLQTAISKADKAPEHAQYLRYAYAHTGIGTVGDAWFYVVGIKCHLFIEDGIVIGSYTPGLYNSVR